MSDTTKAETTQETDLLWTDTYELAQVIARARKLAMEERAIVMRQAQELTRLRAILAALREPSEAVLMAAKLGMEESWPLRQVAIPADWYARALEDAVAAAEQEVGRE